MPGVVVMVAALVLLVLLLYFEKREQRIGMVLTKTPLSLLFIVAVLLQPFRVPPFAGCLLAGMILCLAGDVCLALPQKKMFLMGLIAFLLGHVCYGLGFFWVARVGLWTWIGLFLTIALSGGVYVWLRPHLGAMNVPVLLYIAVITAMVIGSWSILGDENLALQGRAMVFVGAAAFYLSDIFVARDRFLKKEFINRLAGLPMYYAGQFILAFSVGFLKQNLLA